MISSLQNDKINNSNQNRIVGHSQKKVFLKDPPFDPGEFFNRINNLKTQTQLYFALIAAHEMRLFDNLNTTHSHQELQKIYPHTEMILPLLKVLVENNYIKEREGAYYNTPLTSTYFCSSSVYFQGGFLDKINTKIIELWAHLPKLVMEGPVVFSKKNFFCNLCLPPMAENAMTGRLQHVVRSIVSLPEFLNAHKMLDLGGGHGLYSIALASLKKDLNCIVFDLPDIIDVTCDYIIAHNMDEQVKVLPGNFFVDDFGSGYDIILSSSNPSGKNREIIKKIFNALNPGGIFINIQSGDIELKDNPLSILERNMWVLEDEHERTSQQEGKTRPFLSSSYIDSIRSAGFEIQHVETIPDGYFEDYAVTMAVCKKKDLPPPFRSIKLSIQSGNNETYALLLDINQTADEWSKILSQVNQVINKK